MKYFCLLLLSFSSFLLQAQDLLPDERQALETIVNEGIRAGDPGLAVGVLKEGEVIYQSFAGLAMLDYEIPIDAQTSFNIASCAKQFTALTILTLIEKGQLKLHDDFRDIIPGFYPDVEESITIAHLLNHSSGIRDVYDLWGFLGKTWWAESFANRDAFELLQAQQDLDFNPGTKHQYSNSNYLLLTAIVEEVSGQNFDVYADSVFTALGMFNTSFVTNSYDVIPRKARPYGKWGSWKEYPMLADLHGDGALFTTMEDQLHWEAILQRMDNDFLSENILEQSQMPIRGEAVDSYGYGLEFGHYRGLSYRYHAGNTGAYNAMFYRFPSQELTIVVMGNSGSVSVGQVAQQLADVLIDDDEFVNETFRNQPDHPIPATSLEALVGTYQLPNGRVLKVVAEAGTLYIDRYNRERLALARLEGNLFEEVDDPDWKLAFDPGAPAGEELVVYHSGGAPISWKRLEDTWMSYDFTEANGAYYNAELDYQIGVEQQEGDKYTIKLNGVEVGSGQLYLPDVFFLDDYQATFERDTNGEIDRLYLRISNRVQRILFKRLVGEVTKD